MSILETSPNGHGGKIMPKFFVKKEQIKEDKIVILGQDVSHIKKVLRAKIGDELQICNSKTEENFLCDIENIENEKCFDLIKDTNLYGYSILDKRIDEYTNTSEISDELQESSNEDSNIHMGIIAQDIEDNELGKYILDCLLNELEGVDNENN